ncbi:hypothetical protein BV898_18558 [Hypsibius exemplaris]|uniref:Uncharacterized protein n=1 Tax=Hypsibius exemplaris TaxID=2072580 RepID=A0A9X6RNL4_HYPEX|nr:hypothetical protein BV898_18558 [Hypsibius exemplaris]
MKLTGFSRQRMDTANPSSSSSPSSMSKALMRHYKGCPAWMWLGGAAALGGGLYYCYFYYMPERQKQMRAIKEDLDKARSSN